jgi:prepilin-type N-terminal cleavage/methylation domain-containing protein
MRKKGFTLLELVITIIIVAILATLGFTQYGAVIERSRSAEARAILGSIRTFAAAHRMQYRSLAGPPPFDNTQAGIGPALDQIPSTCTDRVSHYFSYAVSVADPVITITATRCTGDTGKPPGRPGGPFTLTLTTNLVTGADTWGGTGGY